ncbi:hypothetical protein ACI7RC_17930 [Brevibacillus sp. B_LB10_24]|uniref:hypothetical protein n=1 Tax=Brevibacillus sp. B_LB10_24 TaxID=3380645 RepID=UPI0038BCB7E2
MNDRRYFACLMGLALVLSGCGTWTAKSTRYDQVIHSDRSFYFNQSGVLPDRPEPNFTPYGTPSNFGTSSLYQRTLRLDSLSDYSAIRRKR